ncbi:hypothetical protein B7494_g6431 [Chlorociboria aeruginascens]|nr:hypothetical protein B7494_g6431 [Chlorociboria aeruginascens]
MVKDIVTMGIASPSYHTFPTEQPSLQAVTTEHVQKFLDILKSPCAPRVPPPPPAAAGEVKLEEPPARASKIELKAVNEAAREVANDTDSTSDIANNANHKPDTRSSDPVSITDDKYPDILTLASSLAVANNLYHRSQQSENSAWNSIPILETSLQVHL